MLKDRDKLYRLYHTVLSMSLSFAVIYAINIYYVLRVSAAVCIFFSVLLGIFIYLFDSNRKNVISYLILIGLVPMIGLFLWLGKINLIKNIKGLINWCIKYDCTTEQYNGSYAYSIVFLVTLALSILFYLILKNNVTKIFLAVGLFAGLITICLLNQNLSKPVIAVSIFYILSISIELCGTLYMKKNGYKEKKAGILYLAPICLLLALLSTLLPSKAEPIQWTVVKNIYGHIKKSVEYFITDLEYKFSKGDGEFAVTGFSDEGGDLGSGEITDSEKVVMKISGEKNKSTIYLIGSVSDIYTGDSWEKSKKDFIKSEEDYRLDYYELLYALSRQDPKFLSKDYFIKNRTININYENIKTKTFFYPLKTCWYQFSGKTSKLNKERSNITFKKAANNKTTYDSTYYEMNLEGPSFKEMLRKESNFSYDRQFGFYKDNVEWVEKNLFDQNIIKSTLSYTNLFQILKKRSKVIKEAYTNLPDGLPDRVRQLALDITKGYDNNYDKLKAIEKYLNTYTYTTKPGECPKGEDFVDYFLFDNKKGYCTSFATSMAVLARCIGIPTRYVEGFVVDYDESAGNNTYLVKSNQSHAWAEAYLEGIGWIPFEATPSYTDMRYAAWEPKVKPSEVTPAVQALDYSKQYGNVIIPDKVSDFETKNTKKELTAKKEGISKALINTIVIIASVIITIIAIILYYVFMRRKYLKAYKRGNTNKKIYILFLRILMLFKIQGLFLNQQETILMFSDRIGAKFTFNNTTFSEIADIFMRYRYAEAELNTNDLEKVELYKMIFEGKQKKQYGRLKIYLNEFIFFSKKEYI